MSLKQPIKIIKPAEQEALVSKNKKSAAKIPNQPNAAREMVATISSWVSEFEQKRREETTEALRKFVAETVVHPSGCTNCWLLFQPSLFQAKKMIIR